MRPGSSLQLPWPRGLFSPKCDDWSVVFSVPLLVVTQLQVIKHGSSRALHEKRIKAGFNAFHRRCGVAATSCGVIRHRQRNFNGSLSTNMAFRDAGLLVAQFLPSLCSLSCICSQTNYSNVTSSANFVVGRSCCWHGT